MDNCGAVTGSRALILEHATAQLREEAAAAAAAAATQQPPVEEVVEGLDADPQQPLEEEEAAGDYVPGLAPGKELHTAPSEVRVAFYANSLKESPYYAQWQRESQAPPNLAVRIVGELQAFQNLRTQRQGRK